jgi:transglutaminase-like putative cysteine protease
MEMKLKIVHETVYEFNDEVFIEPHYLRFKPRVTPYNKLESADFKIFPTPSGLSEQRDAENNLVHFCWFEGMHINLSIRSESVVVLQENNPFNFIVFPSAYFDMPLHYSSHLKDILYAAFLSTKIDNPLIEYGNQILEKSTYKTLNFITNLTNQIHLDFKLESRPEGEPFESDKTFNLKKGSCRDLSWMQIQLLRHMGIAARFVSGYYFIESEDSEHELHGWVEVYLPGAGWVGFDPGNGIVAGSSHIPVCSSAHYQNTMPITGSFRGAADSAMDTSLSIEKIYLAMGKIRKGMETD